MLSKAFHKLQHINRMDDEERDEEIKGLREYLVSLEAERITIVYGKFTVDESRISKCINNIIYLHRDMFMLPDIENSRNCIENEHGYSMRDAGMNVVASDDSKNSSKDEEENQFCTRFTPKRLSSEPEHYDEETLGNHDTYRVEENQMAFRCYFVDDEITPERRGNDMDDSDDCRQFYDNLGGDATEMAQKAFLDLLIDDEIETIPLIKTLIDKFLHFRHKLGALKGNSDNISCHALEDLGKLVRELDELVFCIHRKYSEMIDRVSNRYDMAEEL